jgi:hypothetical protein
MRAFLLRWPLRLLVLSLLLTWAGMALWQVQKRLPPGMHIAGAWQSVPVEDLRFLRDLSAADARGAPIGEQQIDAELLRMVAQAREFVVLDTGLFGDLPAAGPQAAHLRTATPLAATLADALLKARRETPALQVLMLVDPASVQITRGSAAGSPTLERLIAGGIAVVAVDVHRLRAPDAAFAAFWQLCCRWWARIDAHGVWPNPLGVGPSSVSMGLWGETFGFQRSHRQLLIADDGAGSLTGLIFSRSLNAEASLHSATALRLSGTPLEPLLESEFVLAQFSGWSGGDMQARSQRLLRRAHERIESAPTQTTVQARLVSEAAIAEALVQRIDASGRRDSIDIAALYLSQRELVRALLDAARRGAAIRVLLDPGKDGYGYARSGFPNREVATELVAASDGAVRVRWYRTHGEQFSPGFALIRSSGRSWLMIGTAELCRRDLDDLNLAAAVLADMPATAAVSTDALSWFDTLWYNRAAGGVEYTSDVDVYSDASQLDYWQYRLLEASGVSFD